MEEKLCKIYKKMVERYKKEIEEKEYRSISELRLMVSPYNEFIKALKERLLEGIQPYNYENHFFSAVEKATEYIKGIENVQMPIEFYLSFEEIDLIKAAETREQTILLASLLRAFGSESAAVLLTSKRPYVYFKWKDEHYLINPESGSLLSGSEYTRVRTGEISRYLFSDLIFESFE